MKSDTYYIDKKNEAFLHIDAESGLVMELQEQFMFFAPGYQFVPSFRNKMWDGKIRMFDRRTQLLPIGLLKYALEYANSSMYDVEMSPELLEGMKHEPILTIMDYLKSLTITAGDKIITPYDYQYEAVCHALKNKKALLLSPTGSGKSLIIYLLIRYYLEKLYKGGEKILLVVPTVSLVNQMFSDFEDYSQQDELFDVNDICHKVMGGTDKDRGDALVIISTWQSVYQMRGPFFEKFGMIIGDEAHGFTAKSCTNICGRSTNAEYRIGTTGTTQPDKVNVMQLEGNFGPVHQVATTKKLMDDGQLSELDIKVMLLDYDDEYKKTVSKMNYQDEIDFIVSYEKRNNFIINLAKELEGNTLILFRYVAKHGKPLFKKFQENVKDIPLYYISGGTGADEREDIRKIVDKQKASIIVGSEGCLSTGVNIKNIHNIIFASPSKSQIKILQSIGRGLRLSENGRETHLYDLVDNLQWKSKKNYALQHGAERTKIYAKEQFKFKIHNIRI